MNTKRLTALINGEEDTYVALCPSLMWRAKAKL